MVVAIRRDDRVAVSRTKWVVGRFAKAQLYILPRICRASEAYWKLSFT